MPLLGQQVAAVLRKEWQVPVVVAQLDLLKDATRQAIYRCRLEGAPVSSVVLKQIRREPAQGYSDWAALAFLTERVPQILRTSVVLPFPRFYGGDVDGGLFLMEDLGEQGATVEAALSGDRSAAVSALLRLAQQMGRLQGVTGGLEKEFRAQRQRLPAAAGLERQAEAVRWRQALPRFLVWLEALEVTAPAGLAECLEQVAAVYAAPGPLLAFSHGDPAPSNNFIGPERVCLLDFEYAAYRHVLYDITGWDVLCPLPASVLSPMKEAFRDGLGPAFPSLQDSAAFEAAWATLCAYRTVAICTWLSPALLEENRLWAPPDWTAREALLAAVARLAERAAAAPGLGAVQEVATFLGERLQERWPELARRALVPAWPAFQIPGEGD